MEALTDLTGIAVLLITGVIATVLSKKLKMSNVLFLLVSGMIIANTPLRQLEMFHFPTTFLVGFAILSLALIIFDGSSRFNLRALDALSTGALELTIAFMLINMILVTIALNLFYFDFTSQGILFGIIMAVILAGTDPGSVFSLLGDKPHRVLQFLRIEAVINTPIMVIVPFILTEVLDETTQKINFLAFVQPMLLQIIVGIGTGMLLGIVVFKIMRKWYSETLSPVAIMGAALLAYILAENLQGSGVLSVAVLGLVFGNSYVKQKGSIQEFSEIISYAFQILVFILIGTTIILYQEPKFWITSLVVFVAVLLSRYISVKIIDGDKTHKEQLFITFNMSKGLAVAVVALTLYLLNIPGLETILNLVVIIMVYSLILSSIVNYHAKYFLNLDIGQKK